MGIAKAIKFRLIVHKGIEKMKTIYKRELI